MNTIMQHEIIFGPTNGGMGKMAVIRGILQSGKIKYVDILGEKNPEARQKILGKNRNIGNIVKGE